MANLYTKTGDKGTTGLVGGNRVSKDDPRVDCYGIIDEANSMLGLAHSLSENDYVRETVHSIQEKLFTLGAELASDEKGFKILESHDNIIHEEDVAGLEKIADFCTETTGKMTCFVVPGVNQASSALHVARTIVRRAERAMVRASREVEYREVTRRYVNRLSDAIFALARLEEVLVEQKEQEDLKKKITEIILQELGGGAAPAAAPADAPAEGSCLNLEVAKKLSEVAEAKAKAMGVPVVFTVVDNGGNLMLLHRMEDSLQGSIDISMNKAYTANAFKMPTNVLKKYSQPGESLYGIQNTNNGRVVIFGGGYPLTVKGKVVGALGVSGGSEEEDMAIASAACAAFGKI